MSETIQKKKRDVSLDVAKGILIFLVVWGHSIQFGFGYSYGESYGCYTDWIFRFIYTFHMPLFMAISGYLFYYSNKKPCKEVIISRLKSIGIPYLIYCTIMVLILIPTTQMGGARFLMLSTYANGFWFLTSILFNCLLVSCVTLLTRRKWIVTLLLSLISVMFLFISDKYLYGTHNFMFTCFIIGYIYNMLIEKSLISCKTKPCRLLISILLLIGCTYLYNKEIFIYVTGVDIWHEGTIDVHQLTIDIKRIAISIVASISFLTLISWYKYIPNKISEIICNLSRYSLGIYCSSSIMLMVYYKVMGKLSIDITHNYIYPLCLSIIIVALSYSFFMRCEKIYWMNKLFLGGR